MPNTPECIEIKYYPSAEAYFLKLKPLGQRTWLDSAKPESNYGNIDILSAAPIQQWNNPTIAQIEKAVAQLCDEDTLKYLSQQDIPFWGGAIGFFNYEYPHYPGASEQLTRYALNEEKKDASLRDSIFALFDWALIQNHNTKKAHLVFLPCCDTTRKDKVLACLASENAEQDTCNKDISTAQKFHVEDLKADSDREEYFAALEKINEYILAGDTYQVNYSQRFSGNFSGDSAATYLALRKALPSPFCAYIECGEDAILSFSPERFIRIENNIATTQPIKGTAPRGTTEQQDEQLAQELMESEKNRAENLMIVDLLRNDFSKSCEPNTVKVPALFSLESFRNVHHLVSTITGKIASRVSPLEFFMRCFPGGSITGAPKKRAMEIINELETSPRNIYCGSICYLGCSGTFDSSITIRTLLISGGKIYCWGGGGIVADSQPEEEYQESLQKIGVLIKALQA